MRPPYFSTMLRDYSKSTPVERMMKRGLESVFQVVERVMQRSAAKHRRAKPVETMCNSRPMDAETPRKSAIA
jgi:ribose 1,5-bisphosphokinase PhnN